MWSALLIGSSSVTACSRLLAWPSSCSPAGVQLCAAAVQLQLLQPRAGCLQQLLQCCISKARQLHAELGEAGGQRRKDGRHSREPARHGGLAENTLCVVALAYDINPEAHNIAAV
jgi:hypothetical protein